MGIVDWFLKESRDQLAAESKQGKGGITNWLLRQGLDQLAAQSEKNKDLRDLSSSFWTYRFRSYEDAISYLDSLKAKYQDSTDREMKQKIDHACEYAKDYFHKNTK